MSDPVHSTFSTAAFDLTGELVGVRLWEVSALSVRWLKFWRDTLRCNGAAFSISIPIEDLLLRLRFTSADGAALATFSIDEVLIASSVFLRGSNPDTERELLGMFVDSIRQVRVVRQCQATQQPFSQVFSILERPLHVGFAWGTHSGNQGVIMADLGNHLAGAFLCECSSGDFGISRS